MTMVAQRVILTEERIPSIMQQAHSEPEAPPPRIKLQVACPTPTILSCDTSVAHLAWEQPQYLSPPTDVALPELEANSFQIEWAEASGRSPKGVQQISEDAWRPLPSGDVVVAEVKVAGLRPGRSYAIRVNVTLNLSHFDNTWDVHCKCSPAKVFTTVASVPSAVKPPLLVSRDRKSLKVKWHVPEEPGGEDMVLDYQLFMSPPPQGWHGPPDPQGYVVVYQGRERNCKVMKLVPGARYSFWVLANNSVGYSEPGQVATYTTQATVPAQPEAPRPVSCTQSSITLQWVAPPGNGAPVTNYVLERDEGGPLAAQRAGQVPNIFMLAYAGPLQTVMVGGLRSGVHYRFRLRAENEEGQSFWSEPLLATPAASPPGAPVQVVISGITQQSATVAWLPPAEDGGCPVVAHEVQIQAVSRAAAESMGPDWLKIFEGCILACTISSLQPGCTYRLRVRCANQAGWGSWCMPVELLTAPDVPGAPGAPVIQQAGTTTLTLTWQPPRHNGGQRITAFLVELSPDAPSTYSGPVLPRVLPGKGVSAAQAAAQAQAAAATGEVLVYRGEETVAHVVGLQPGILYRFRVQASNSIGVGPWSDWSTLGTAPDVPSAMLPPRLAAPATSTALKVCWQPPDACGAPVTGYLLQAAVQGRMTSSGQLIPHSASAVNLGALQNGDSSTEAGADAAAPIAPQHAGLVAGPWQQVYKGPAVQTEMPGLQPCTRYLLRVAAQNPVGLGGWSPVTALTTAPAPPRAPAAVSATAAGTSAVLVSWQPPVSDNGSAVTGYMVDMMPAVSTAASRSAGSASGSWQQVAATPAGELAAEVDGLLPGKAYSFRVRASNACGVSPHCVLAAPVTTDPAPPSAPLRLMVTQRAATQVKVRWEEPSETNGQPVTEYLLELACLDPPLSAESDDEAHHPHQQPLPAEPRENGHAPDSTQPVQQQEVQVKPVASEKPQGPVWESVYCGPETSVRVSQLRPGCSYQLRVSATNKVGWSPCSQEEPFTTALAPPSPPEGLEAWLTTTSGSSDDTHAVQLRWLAPVPGPSQAQVASYELHAVPVAPGHGHEMRKVVGKATSFSWEELQPGLRYAIRVRAAGVEGTGHGAWSEAVEIVMPGNSRGVTDSADSMSAASGTGELTPLSALGGLSAVNLGKVNMDRGARKRSGKKSGRQPSATRQASAVTTALSEIADDAMSVTSQAQLGRSSTGAASAARNRVNTSKLSPVAVQKRPKAAFQLGRELRQLVAAPGQSLRKAHKTVSRSISRFVSKNAWYIVGVIGMAILVFLITKVYQQLTKGPSTSNSHTYRYHSRY